MLLVALAGAATAGERGDHEDARAAVERGEARPLADILPIVRDALGGEVVGVDFEKSRHGWIYEFKVITPDGQRHEVYVGALDGRVLKRKTD